MLKAAGPAARASPPSVADDRRAARAASWNLRIVSTLGTLGIAWWGGGSSQRLIDMPAGPQVLGDGAQGLVGGHLGGGGAAGDAAGEDFADFARDVTVVDAAGGARGDEFRALGQ